MKRRYLTTLIWGLIFAGLLVWVYTQERGRVSEKGEIFRLQLTDVSALQIQGVQNYTLVRQGKEWYFTAPFSGLADPGRVESVVNAVAALKPIERKNQNLSDPSFGLGTAVLTVNVTYAGNRSAAIRLGAQSPLGSKYFAAISGRPSLFLIDQSFKTSFETDPAEMREKRMANLAPDKIDSVVVNRAAETVTVQREALAASPTWAITAPRSLKADQTSLDSLARALQNTTAVDFLPYTREDLTACGLSRPQVSVTFYAQDHDPFTVYVGKQDRRMIAAATAGGTPSEQDVTYACRTGRWEILVLPATFLSDLNKGLLDLRDKKVLGVKQEQVVSLKVQRTEGLSFKIQQINKQWQVVAPKTGQARPDRVDALLYSLTDLAATDYAVEDQSGVDLSKYGLKAPRAAFLVGLQDGSEIELAVGNEVPERRGVYYARTSLSGDVYLIGDALVRDLPLSAEDLIQAPGSAPPGGMPGGMEGMPPGMMPPGGMPGGMPQGMPEGMPPPPGAPYGGPPPGP